jgi:2-polyprenyl-6-methoxyphenol hydroxylase-like FAD-dependent oxidoreductase
MKLLVIGGGICGLGTALLLARDGHDVTVLERDSDQCPDSPTVAWDMWTRKGVAQFRQPHNFMPGLRRLLEEELPDVQDALRDAGASRYDLLRPLPPSIADTAPRAIDDQLWTYTARRPVGEWVLRRVVERERNITLRRGIRVVELIGGPAVIDGLPHVAGARADGGEEFRADLVVDASGRQSRAPAWVQALGARPPYEEQTDSGFMYFTRYFTGSRAPDRRGPILTALGTISLLTLQGDNGTWSVTIFSAAGDRPLKNLRHADRWTSVVRACPLHAHWTEGEPITDVLPMSGVTDRYRRFVVGDKPVATGFVAVADAWACTNPSAGRGLTIGFIHARLLRDVLRETGGEPRRLIGEFDRRTESEVKPWYDAQFVVDRARYAEMDALREGRMPPAPSDPLCLSIVSLMRTMGADPDLFRAALEYIGTLTPIQTIVARPEVRERMLATHERMKDVPPMPLPGPSRTQLLDLVG